MFFNLAEISRVPVEGGNFPIQGVVLTTSKHDAGIQLAFPPGSLAGE